jgi:DNA-binding MarR family transcriptional regulator
MPLKHNHPLRSGPMCAAGTLRRANRVVSRYYDSILKPSGLRSTQYTILSVAAAKTPVALNPMARMLVMDRSTLARDLQPLERQGLLAIDVDPNDNRVRLISITPKGLETLKIAQPLWQQAQGTMADIFGEDRLLQLVHELKEVTGLAAKV